MDIVASSGVIFIMVYFNKKIMNVIRGCYYHYLF